jgi:hypothetical protein
VMPLRLGALASAIPGSAPGHLTEQEATVKAAFGTSQAWLEARLGPASSICPNAAPHRP